MENKGIINVCEAGKMPILEGEFILVGFEDKTFTDQNGKAVAYTDVTLSTGLQSFIVSASVGHRLETVKLGMRYSCKFFVNKKKIKLIGLFDISK